MQFRVKSAHGWIFLAAVGNNTIGRNLDVDGVNHAEIAAVMPVHLLYGIVPEVCFSRTAKLSVNGYLGNAGNI
ncbi:MAG: hypothetical protein OJI67_06410 [Prosthecobacter sp.]|nr:hypothetical protein [Prosthecobacter sp.]